MPSLRSRAFGSDLDALYVFDLSILTRRVRGRVRSWAFSWAVEGIEEDRVTTTVDNATTTPVAIGEPRRAGRADPAQGQLVGRAGGDGRDPARLRHLLDLGRLRRQELLRRRRPAPRPDLTLLLPLYRQQLRGRGATPSGRCPFWNYSPALLILIFPLGFRLTCYYYRKAYYRSFWLSPPACGVADAHGSYSGETRFPLILQNIHRYFFWILLLFNCILTYDAILAFRQPVGVETAIGISVGTRGPVRQRRLPLAVLACRATPAATSAAGRSSRSPSTPPATSSGSSSRRSTRATCASPGSASSVSPCATSTCGWWPAAPSTTRLPLLGR